MIKIKNNNLKSKNSDINNNENYSKVYKQKSFLFFSKNIVRKNTKNIDEMLKVPKDKELLATLRNLDITYGHGFKAFRAVSDINLNIYKGEVLGLVGESGSGKSTIGKALVGLVPYSFGEIHLVNKLLPKKLYRGFKFGKALKEYKEINNFLTNKVQMIFQDPANSLNPHANIEKIVSEGLVNTKNAKEIYLYNFDQNTKKEIYELLKKENENTNYFANDYEKQLDDDIKNSNQEIAFESLYIKLKNDIQNQQMLSEAISQVFEEKTKIRNEITKISEKDARKKLVIEILKQTGLDESILRRYPLEFSGGQQQRIGISRSVVLRPELLIADEPISALDVSIQAQVVNLFNELKEKYDLTILFIAHDLRMVEYISNRIAVMNKGRIVEIGSTNEIMKNSFHPYTKSLLDAVPSIHGKKGSLVGYVYNPKIHKYTETNQPEWVKINDNHFVFATKEEVEEWKTWKK
ncbi:ABC transporter ATP-binding protein [Mesomycoplasma neurolyticum]|uniref:Phosphate ABC transporter ATP-binding protein n=1 Tax=Mesomycoplasma neurolyticum TaxID=2120 RepID=A0A449A4R4_9BACT|nr:ABC transporter ATP-binding protein [Mesomycoplasma neurolyticum]VEU59212.1 phosphate ABC transporter ATP-binding protein [Mesomycoplasma neurolyticum]